MHSSSFGASISPAGIAGETAAQIAAFLAALLFASAAHKVRQRARSGRAAEALAGLRAPAARLAVAGLAAGEALAGAALLVPAARLAGACLAALIWGGYFALLARALRSGRGDVDCGCSFGAAHARLGAAQLTRTGALALVATLVAGSLARAGRGAFDPVRAITAAIAAIALLVLYLAFDRIAGERPSPAGAMR